MTLFKGKISYEILVWSQASLLSKELTIFIYFELINVFGTMRSCLLHNDFHSCLFLYSCMLQGSEGHVSCISIYCSMADGISFEVSLSLNCETCTNAKEELRNRTLTSRFWKLESGLYAPPSLVIHRKWLLHHRKVTRYSCNLNIGMERKHTVQTQIRLCRPKSDCSI